MSETNNSPSDDQAERDRQRRELWRQQDLDMMLHPGKWPFTFVLPMKKSDSNWRSGEGHAFMYSPMDASVKPVLYMASAFDYIHGDTKLSDVPTKEFDSFEAILDDGWTVD